MLRRGAPGAPLFRASQRRKALPTLLVATTNPGKLREYRELLNGLPCELCDLRAVGITFEPEETGSSYEENAALKAQAYAHAARLLTLADDSGIEVHALGGAPGLHSARYGGPGLSDAQRVDLLLSNLAGVDEADRTARFVCAIAIASSDGVCHLVRGECHGRVLHAPRGTAGFGYDPVFLLPERGLTMAELSAQEKNRVSHRARAAQAALPLLRSLLADA